MKKIDSVNNSKAVLGLFSGVKSRITSIMPALYHVITPMLFVAFGLFGLNESAWGTVTTSGTITSTATLGGKSQYVVWTYTGDEKHTSYRALEVISRTDPVNRSSNTAPAGDLYIELKRAGGWVLASQTARVDVSVNNSSWTDVSGDISVGTSYNTYGGYSIARDAKYVRLISTGGAKDKYHKKVYMTLASFCETATTELSYGSKTYLTEDTLNFTINWSNKADAQLSISGTDASHYEIIEAKAAGNKYIGCAAGKYGYTTVKVRYKRDAVGTHNNATLSGGGISIALKGSTTAGTPTIDCSKVSASTLTYGQKLSVSTISGPSASYKNGSYAGTYTWKRSDASTHVAQGCTDYVVKFTPSNSNLNSVECASVQVPITKVAQTITWSPSKTYLVDEDIQLSASTSGDASVYFESANTDVATIDGNWLRMVGPGDVVIKARANTTCNYLAAEDVEYTFQFRRRPTIVFAEPEHIYSGNTLDNMAKLQYNSTDLSLEEVDFDYSFDNPSWFSLNPSNAKQILVSTDYGTEQYATIYVTTKETNHYTSVSASKTYYLEVKKTPEFYLSGTLLDKTKTTDLYLEIDSTATFTFDKITSGFQYPTKPSHFTYNNATGVLTATVAGDETFFFNEPGDGITFQHQCNLHLYVRKHETELELSSLVDDNAVWMVDDSVAESSIYELVKGDANEPVVISSDKPGVIAKENGKWVAKGKGSAVLTIAQVNSDKWTGDTITRTINVNRYDPVFDWSGLPDTLNFNTTFVNPVRSTSDGAITYKSNKSAVTVTNESTTLHTAETADNAVTITAIQKPTYKYEGKTATKTVKVLKLRNHVQVEVKSNETYLAVRNKTEGDVAYTSDGIRLGGSKTGIGDDPAWDWYDKYVDIKFEGIPGTISFTTGNTSVAPTAKVTTLFGKGAGNNNGFWYMIEYPEGESANTLWTENDNANPGYISRDLKPNTNKVRICYTGNFAGYVKNLTITERTELSIHNNVESLDFGSTDAGSNATKKNFTFDWYNLNPLTLSIEGGDGKYSVSPSSISSKKDSFALNESVEVSYIHTAGGTHNATLVISEGTTELKRIPLTGTTNKVTPAITWKENLSPMSRGENVTDPAEAIVELVYTSSDSTVVDVEGNVLKPLKKGNATITASYDGSESLIYNSNSSTINVLVTNLAVQHIHWTQTFTRLKWSDDPVLSEKNTPDFDFDATVSYYDPETSQEVEITDRSVTYTSGSEAVVKVLPGNKLHVVGQGTTTLTAHIDGIVDSLYEATVVRDVIVREPTLDCEKWVLENKSASMATEINSFSGVETVYDLTGEPGYLSFEAWREAIHVIRDWTYGNLFVAEYVNSEWQEITGNDGLALDLNYAHRKAFDSIPMSREATKVKIFKKTGSTGIHAFSNAYVTLARYLELENTKNKKTHSIHLTTTEAKPGVAVEKTFTVNYSNITDQLDVELKHGDKFSIVSDATIGNECGDKGNATVRVRFLSNDVDLYKDTLLVHNLTDTVLVYLSADVDRLHQQITWNPSTLNLLTTDNVTFDAVTSASAAGRTISYAVTAGSDVASVNAATGALTIIQNGDVTIEASAAGNDKYYDAEAVSYTFHIEKVTPTITKAPTASAVTLPATLAASTWMEAGTASVAGTFSWTNPSTALVAGDIAYEVTFTPENTNWYTTATCMVTPQVSKASQTITWDFNVTEMYGNADYTFDATASSGLQVAYSSSNDEIASVNGVGHLVLHQGGEVTITASQSGDGTYLPASESRTFTILRWTPTIAENPVGGEMYVGRVLSDASLTGGRAEVNGQTIQGSFNWENANTATIDVPGPTTHNVIFVPQNGNFYNEVNCGPIELTVLRYVPVVTSNTLSADGIEFPLTLENSHIHGSVTAMDYVHIPNVEVTGHVEWKEPTTILRPGTHTATALFVPDNSDWYEAKEIPLSVQVTGGYVFNGDNTDWTEENNWDGNLMPTGTDDPVLINTDVEITSEVTVGSLTIAENVNVIVKNGGKLRIGNSDSETRAAYGNLHVENGGKVLLGTGQLNVNNFYLDANLGITDEDVTTASASGEVQNEAMLSVAGDAYFQLALDPSGRISYGWYDFTVPFAVDVIGGISVAENTSNVPLEFNKNYAVMDYTEAKRAVNGKDWNKFSGTMVPGRVYTIALDDDYEWNTVIFKKKAGAAITGDRSFTTEYSGLGANNKDNGWNGFGNGTLHHTELDVDDKAVIQLYDHKHKCYQARPAKDYTIAVGLSFFMQFDKVETINLLSAEDNGDKFMAPKREVRAVDHFRLALTAEDAVNAADYIWVSASEEATAEYTIGSDVLKMGTLSEATVARMWTKRDGMNLCKSEMQLVDNEANCELGLFAPQARTYTIAIEEAPEDADLYLTYNGEVIWDLTASPYVLDLAKGMTDGYGLRVEARAPQIATGVDETNADSKSVRKVLINNTIYLITPEGKMYDIVGKSAKY